MHFSQPLGSALGQPENHVIYLSVNRTADRTGAIVEFEPAPGLGESWWGVYLNARRAAVLYAREGERKKYRISLPWGTHEFDVTILHHGDLADPSFSATLAARTIDSEQGRRTVLDWTWPSETLGDLDDESGWLSGWVINGLLPWSNVEPVDDKPTWGRLAWTLSVSGGTATVQLLKRGVIVASGSGAVGTTVSLAESNSSGVIGTVNVLSGALTDSDGGHVYVRFPASAQVLRGSSSPPTTLISTILFRGDEKARWVEPSTLSPGTYYYALRMVSDTGTTGTASSSSSVVIEGHPSGPSGFSGFSGTKNSFKVGVLPSPTPGASYALYAGDIGEVMDMVTPVLQENSAQVARFEMGPFGFTGFSGTATILVVGFSGGLGSPNGDVLELEFDQFSAWIPARPNHAGLVSWSATGLNLSVIADQSTESEDIAASDALLFARAEGGVYDEETPSAMVAFSSPTLGIRRATLSWTAPSDGLYWIRVLAAASDGTRSVKSDGDEILVYLSTATPTAISGFSAAIGRG